MREITAGNSFWDFSVTVYGREGVAPACLELQERLGLDVNLLLFACWAGCRGRPLSRDETARLVELTEPWQEQVVRPLRGVRRWLKGQDLAPAEPAAALRARVKTDELTAEAIQQRLLFETLEVPEGEGGPETVAANVLTYLDALGQRARNDDAAALAAVIGGCCPDVPPLEALRLLGA